MPGFTPCRKSRDSLLLRPPPPLAARQEGPQAVPHLGVHQGAHEDKGSAQPVPACEGVLEVEDGEDEADELAERHHQGDGERRALRGQDEHAADADVPGTGRLRDGRDGQGGLSPFGKGKEQGDGGNSLLGSAWSEQDTANSGKPQISHCPTGQQKFQTPPFPWSRNLRIPQ